MSKTNRGNFFEVGLRQPLGNLLRLDVNHYWRRFENYIDDDVFLNTAGDVRLLPKVLDAAARFGGKRPADPAMQDLVTRQGMAPLFV